MIHATAEQIHDHACGFRRSEHVDSCDDCGRAADLVAGEIEALREVLAEEAPRAASKARVRAGPAALAAAALLLGTLSWLLFQPPSAPRTPAAPLPSQEHEIQRLIVELRSRSPLRQEIARFALKQYMGTGLEALTRAGVDPLFIDEIRGVTDRDRALIRKMKTAPFSMTLDRVLYTEVLYELEKIVGTVQTEFTGSELDTAYVSIDVRNGTVQDAVEQLCAGLRMPFRVVHSRLTIGKRSEVPSLAPVRLRPQGDDPARHVPDLSSDLPERRERASEALRRLGFAAEPALWEALDAESLETRSRATALLKRLYTDVHPSLRTPAGMNPVPRITIALQGRPFAEIAAAVLAQGGGNYGLVWDTRVSLPERSISLTVREIALDGALKLLVAPYGFACASFEECAFVRIPAASAVWTPPLHVLWTKAEKARAIEPLLEDLASSDLARRDGAVRGLRELPPSDALDGLAYAAGYLDGASLARCQRLRREIAETEKTWIQDLPSGADLQILSPAQKALLDSVVPPFEGALSLEEILRKAGVRAVVRAPTEETLRLLGKSPKLSTLLKIVLRSQGLDFYLEGNAVVVDTTANVRFAVEK